MLDENTSLFMYFWLFVQRSHESKTIKLMASGGGRHETQLERVSPSLITTHSSRESEWVKA